MFRSSRSINRSEPCGVCGETETLAILDEFHKLYECKLQEIDECDDDICKAEEKIKTLRSWVADLTSQNHMLVKAVEELEDEASQRVAILETKLREHTQQTYNRISEAHAAYNQQQSELVQYLRSDINNLLEVIKRAREKGILSADGLSFYEVRCSDIYGHSGGPTNIQLKEDINNIISLTTHVDKIEKEKTNLQRELESVNIKFQSKLQENENLLRELNNIKKSARDMRDALTAEVADKHDSIRALRKEYDHLEKQCKQIDKQAHFKDDIIKELRKQLRNVKEDDVTLCSKDSLLNEMVEYRKNLNTGKNHLLKLKQLIDAKNDSINEKKRKIIIIENKMENLHQTLNSIQQELNNFQSVSSQYTLGSSEIDRRIKRSHDRLSHLQKEYKSESSDEHLSSLLMEEIIAIHSFLLEKEKKLLSHDSELDKNRCLMKTLTSDVDDVLSASSSYFQNDKILIEKKAMEVDAKIKVVEDEILPEWESSVNTEFNEVSSGEQDVSCNIDPNRAMIILIDFLKKVLKLFYTEEEICQTLSDIQCDIQTDNVKLREAKIKQLICVICKLENIDVSESYFYNQRQNLNKENRELNQTIENLQEQLRECKQHKVDGCCNTDTTICKEEMYKSELEKANVEIDRLQKALNIYVNRVRNMQSDVSQLQDINQNLEQSLKDSELKSADEASSEIGTSEVGSVEITDSNELEALKKKVIDLEFALSAKETINENLQQAVYLHQNTISELKKQCEDLQMNTDSHQQTIDSLQDNLLSVKRELTDLKAKRTQEYNYLNNVVYSLQHEISCFEELYLAVWNDLSQQFEREHSLRETIFNLETQCFYLEQDNLVLEIQLNNSLNQLRFTWRVLSNSQLQKTVMEEVLKLQTAEISGEQINLESKLRQLECLCVNKDKLIESLKNDLENKDQFISTIVDEVGKSDQIIAETKLIDQVVTILKEKVSTVEELKHENEKQRSLINELQLKLNKMEMDLNKLESNSLSKRENEKVASSSDYLSSSNFSDAKDDEQSIAYFEALRCELVEANACIKELKRLLKKCKCEEYMKEIKRLQKENVYLKNHHESGILDRELFTQMTNDLSVELAETKKYLQFLQEILVKEDYTADLEGKNYTLTSTILEMEKYIECLKVEITEAAKMTCEKCNQQVEQLNSLLETKTTEINKLRTLLNSTKSTLDSANEMNKELSGEVVHLREQLNCYSLRQFQDSSTLADILPFEDNSGPLLTMQENMNVLNNMLCTKSAELEEIQNDCQKQLNTIQMLQCTLMEEKEKFQNDTENLKSAVKILEHQLECTRNENEHLKSQLTKNQSHIKSIQSTQSIQSEKYNALIDILSEKEILIKKIGYSLNCKSNSSNQLKNIENSISLLQMEKLKIDKIFNENIVLKEKNAQLEHLVCKLQAEQENADKKHQSLSSEFDRISHCCECRDESICELTNRIKHLEIDLSAEREHNELHLNQKEKIIRSLQSQLKIDTEQSEEADKKIEMLQQELSEKDCQLKDAEDEFTNNLEQTNSKYKNAINEFKRELLLKEQTIDELRECLKKFEYCERKLCEENSELEKRLKEKDSLIQNLHESLNFYSFGGHKQNDICECQINNNLSICQKPSTYHNEIVDDLKLSLCQKQSKIKELSIENSALKEEITQKNLTIDKFLSNHNVIVADLEMSLECVKTKLENEISQLEQIVQNYRDSLEQKDEILSKQKDEIFNLKYQLDTKEAEIEKLKNNSKKVCNEVQMAGDINREIFIKKLEDKNRVISRLKTSLKQNGRHCQDDENDPQRDNFICELQNKYIKEIKCLEHQCAGQIDEIVKLKQENSTIRIQLHEEEQEKCFMKQHLDRMEKDREREHAHNKKCFMKMTSTFRNELQKLQHVNAENECLISEIKKIKDQSDNVHQAALNEISGLKSALCQKETLINELTTSKTKQYAKIHQQTENLLKQYKHQLKQNDEIIQDLLQNCSANENQIKTLQNENKKLFQNLKSKDEIIMKFIKEAEQRWYNLEDEWSENFKQVVCEKNDLEKKNACLENKIKLLMNTNQAQNCKIGQMSEKIACQQNLIEEIQSELETNLNGAATSRKNDLVKYNTSLMEKDKELQECRLKLEQTKQKLNQTVARCNCLEGFLCEKEAEIEQLKIVNAKRINNELKNLQIENSQLKITNNMYANINQDLKFKLEQSNNTLAVVVEDIALLKDYIRFTRADCEATSKDQLNVYNQFEANIQRNNEQYEQMSISLEELQELLCEKDHILESTKACFENENIDQLNQVKFVDSDSTNKEVNRLQETIKSRDQTICCLQKQVDELNETVASINCENKKNLDAVEEKYKNEINRYEKDITDLKNTQIQLKCCLQTEKSKSEECNNQIEMLKNQLKDYENICKEDCPCKYLTPKNSRTNEDKIQFYENRLAEKEKLIKELNGALACCKSSEIDVICLREQLDRRDDMIENLKKEIDDLKATDRFYNQNCAEKDQLIEKYKADLNETIRRLNATNRITFHLKSELSRQKCNQHKLKLTYDRQLKNNHTRYRYIVMDMRNQFKEKSRIISDFQVKLEQNGRKLTQCQDALSKLSKNIKNNETVLNQLSDSYERDIKQIVDQLNDIVSGNYFNRMREDEEKIENYLRVVEGQNSVEPSVDNEQEMASIQTIHSPKIFSDAEKNTSSLSGYTLLGQTFAQQNLSYATNESNLKNNSSSKVSKSGNISPLNSDNDTEPTLESRNQSSEMNNSPTTKVSSTKSNNAASSNSHDSVSTLENRNRLSHTSKSLSHLTNNSPESSKPCLSSTRSNNTPSSSSHNLAPSVSKSLPAVKSAQMSVTKTNTPSMDPGSDHSAANEENSCFSPVQSENRYTLNSNDIIPESPSQKEPNDSQKSLVPLYSRHKSTEFDSTYPFTTSEMKTWVSTDDRLSQKTNSRSALSPASVPELVRMPPLEQETEKIPSIPTKCDKSTQNSDYKDLKPSTSKSTDSAQMPPLEDSSLNKDDDSESKIAILNERHTHEINDCYETIIKQQKMIKELEVENVNLQTSLLSAAPNENEGVQLKIKSLQVDIEKKNCTLKSYKTKNFYLTVEMKKLQKRCAILKETLNEHEKQFKLQKQKVLKDNEKLKNHLTQLITNYKNYNEYNQQASLERENYCQELYQIRNEKVVLEKDNVALATEITNLRKENHDLRAENDCKTKKIQNLESELSHMDNSREELRLESKNVIENVRIWIQEQHDVNTKLNESINEKCSALERLKKERLKLLKEIDDLKNCNKHLADENKELIKKLNCVRSDCSTTSTNHNLLCYNCDSSKMPNKYRGDSDPSTSIDSNTTPSNITKYCNLCPRRSLLVIEPCCHGPGRVCRIKEIEQNVCMLKHSSITDSNSSFALRK